jgi:hypothetical protein
VCGIALLAVTLGAWLEFADPVCLVLGGAAFSVAGVVFLRAVHFSSICSSHFNTADANRQVPTHAFPGSGVRALAGFAEMTGAAYLIAGVTLAGLVAPISQVLMARH